MPLTIGWLAVAIAAGSLMGLMIGHWSLVAQWLHRCLEDPVGRPPDVDRPTSVDKRLRMSPATPKGPPAITR